MRRRGSASIAANPVLIGAATTLVVIVAVFLAYNANNGLPFVPSYTLKAEVPSAAQLVKGNEVRLGGTRVGVVDAIDSVRHANGSVTAELSLKLETTVNPLPTDLVPVMRNLSDPRTRLPQLFRALEQTASQVAPVAETQGQLFDNLDTTFRAFSNVARPYIQQAIVNGPPALDEATRDFP